MLTVAVGDDETVQSKICGCLIKVPIKIFNRDVPGSLNVACPIFICGSRVQKDPIL